MTIDYETVIEGTLYYQNKLQPGCIGIENGKIVAIKKILKGEDHYNFGRKLILPAGIDMHVHFREPGSEYKEDFATGSFAALSGGITTVFDMPNNKPRIIDSKTLKEKFDRLKNKSFVDFGLYCALTEKTDTFESAKLCSAFKCFWGTTTDTLAVDRKYISEIFRNLKGINRIVSFHAEDPVIIQNKQELQKSSRTLFDHANSRPVEAELKAVMDILSFAPEFHVHFAHISASDSIIKINSQPSTFNFQLSTEVTPHHLLLDYNKPLNAFGKVNPPLRAPEVRDKLFQQFINGKFDVLASDHAPHTISEKKEKFNDAPAGITSVEFIYPLFLALVKRNLVPFDVLVNSIAVNPGKIMNLSKGEIKKNYDADVIVIDPQKVETIKEKHIKTKCRWSPYLNSEVIFPECVFLRGNLLIENFEFKGRSLGRVVSRE